MVEVLEEGVLTQLIPWPDSRVVSQGTAQTARLAGVALEEVEAEDQ